MAIVYTFKQIGETKTKEFTSLSAAFGFAQGHIFSTSGLPISISDELGNVLLTKESIVAGLTAECDSDVAQSIGAKMQAAESHNFTQSINAEENL